MSKTERILFLKISIILILFLQACKSDDTPDGSTETPEPKADINENTSTSFTIQETYSSEFERNRLLRNQGASDIIPTGLYLKPNSFITVSHTQVSGNDSPIILLGGYSREVWTDSPTEFSLGNGNTVVRNNSTQDMPVFIRYSGNTPDSESTVTIEGGHKSPYFIYNTTANAEFVTMLDDYIYSDAILSSDKATIVISKETARRYKGQDWNLLLERIGNIIERQIYIDGLDGSATEHLPNRNKYYFTESNDDDYWMAATSQRTFYNSTNAIDFLIDVDQLKDDGWGPWHELGHQRQISSLTWNQTVEVTVNIYSLVVQRSFNQQSRLVRDNVWSQVDTYLNSPINQRDYNSDDLGLFPRLALYQQLWLKYGDDFFINLHKKAREDALSLSTNEEKMSYFILAASQVTQNNLNDFFKAWGFKLPDSSFEAVDNLGFNPPSEDLTLLREN